MTEYVAGFAFNEYMTEVIMVRKKQPKWQEGKLNAVGGKIEDSDFSPVFAMIREFEEETGIETTNQDWENLIILLGNDWKVNFFMITLDNDTFYSATSMEEEEILIIQLQDLDKHDRIDNIDLLIEMCLYLARTGYVFT